MTRIRPIREQINAWSMRNASNETWARIEQEANDFGNIMRLAASDFRNGYPMTVNRLNDAIALANRGWSMWNTEKVARRCNDRVRFARACLGFVLKRCRLVLDVDRSGRDA